MFNFFVIQAVHDMVIDSGTDTTYRRKCKALLTNRSIENGGPCENMNFNGKTV